MDLVQQLNNDQRVAEGVSETIPGMYRGLDHKLTLVDSYIDSTVPIDRTLYKNVHVS